MAAQKMITKEIKVGGKSIQAVCMPMIDKNLIVLRGDKGYVMCGYLNMAVANKFKEIAVKVAGVSSIEDTLRARVCSCSAAARQRGIRKGQVVATILPYLL